MAKNIFDKCAARERKMLYSVTAIALFALYTLCCFVLSPLYTSAVSDISFSDSILPDALMLLYGAFEVIAISVAYAAMIRGLFRFGVKGYAGGFGIFMGATLYKYLANTLISWLYGGIASAEVGSDLLNILFYVLLEGIQLLVVILIVRRTVAGDRERAEYARREGIKLLVAAEEPMTRLFDRKHPMCRAAIYCAAVVFASKLLGEVFNDLVAIIAFGLPERAVTALLMALNYLSCAVFGAICYGAVVLLLFILQEKSAKL